MNLPQLVLESIEKLRQQGRVFEKGKKAEPIEHRLSEEEFMLAVIELAGRCGWKHYHTYDSRKSVAGWPDLVLARKVYESEVGRLIFAECKAQDGKTTPEQDDWLKILRSTCNEVYVWKPSDWNTIQELLA